MAESPRPKIFITHSWRDIDFARRLYDDLKAQGFEVWFDDKTLQAGHRMAEEINRGLAWCNVYIPIISRAALASGWCDEEINAAITLSNEESRHKKLRIIPILWEECRGELLERYPSLASRLYINFAGRYEDALRQLMEKGFRITEPVAQKEPGQEELTDPNHQPMRTFPFSMLRLQSIFLLLVGGAFFFLILVSVIFFVANSQFGAATPKATLGTTPALPTPTITLVPTAILSTSTPTPTSKPTETPRPTASPTVGIIVQHRGNDNAEMVFVSSGEFTMGGNQNKDDENPAHIVYLDAFWIDKYEVTNAQFQQFVTSTNYKTDAEKQEWAWVWRVFEEKQTEWKQVNGASWRSPKGAGSQITDKMQHPVVQVSWNDAYRYCQWAGKRLPTEAEWEKAARGTDKRTYPWGNSFDERKVNFCDSNCKLPWREPSMNDGYEETAPVGTYVLNISPYGAFDMVGNVWEWTADWYDAAYYSKSPYKNPTGPSSGKQHVQRGGAWIDTRNYVLAVSRAIFEPGPPVVHIGFRCAMTGSPP